MSNFPYAQAPNKLEELLQSVQTVGVPEKASTNWLKSTGFTSSNDVSMIRVLKFIGLLDSSSVPTEVWQSYRDRDKARTVLAASIRHGYSDLFDHFPDADARSHDDLTNYIAARTTLGTNATQKAVKTFQALCSLADFSADTDNGASTGDNGNAESANAGTPLVAPPPNIESPTPTLHIDFQVHIAADAPPEQIDKIFESMAKHLYGKDAE
ncbi:MAG: DUF5343 domain-containing protein [Chloroflexi bacterium]|nr:DUF5343 domain-containing protein [Chloroflexota bacterium]